MDEQFGDAVACQCFGGECFGQDEPAALAGVGRSFNQDVVQGWSNTDGQGGGECPRGGGPNGDGKLYIRGSVALNTAARALGSRAG